MMSEMEYRLSVDLESGDTYSTCELNLKLDSQSMDALCRWLADGKEGELKLTRYGVSYASEQGVDAGMTQDRDRFQKRLDDRNAPWTAPYILCKTDGGQATITDERVLQGLGEYGSESESADGPVTFSFQK